MKVIGTALDSLLVLADETAPSGFQIMLQHLLAAVVFAVVGILVLCFSFWLMNKLSPFPLMKEIEEDQNVALGIIMGSVVIGMSIIIAAAIIG